MLIFYPLCYAAVLKNLAHYAQYYAQKQELCSAHIVVVCIKLVSKYHRILERQLY